MCLTLREVQNPEKLPGLDVDLIHLAEVVFIASDPREKLWRGRLCSMYDIAVWGRRLCVLLLSGGEL